MFGMALRTQPVPINSPCYNTFTIRYKRHTGNTTEYAKRHYAIDNNYIYPKYTIQTYTDANNKIRSAAYVDTKELYQYIENNPDKIHYKDSDNLFAYVNWTDLTASCNIKICGEDNHTTASIQTQKDIIKNALRSSFAYKSL
jgi:hypothetical protein